VRDVVAGKTFDNGVLCSSENAVVVDEAVADVARAEFVRAGAHFLAPAEAEAVARVLVTPQRLPNPALVGKTATFIAERAGIMVPPTTRVLIAPLEGVGRDYPLSIEKLCPVLAFYVVKDWREGCERCKQILRYGGMGHTMAIHSRDDEVILQFGLHKPAFRIVVNTPTTHGSTGMTTELDPALTLGCGGWGGNITSDNISSRHLLNIKRLAYGVRPAVSEPAGFPQQTSAAPAVGSGPREPSPADLGGRVEGFLASRGFREGGPAHGGPAAAAAPVAAALANAPASPPVPPAPDPDPVPVDFVCEEDVREAVRAGRKIRLAERAIVTPAARDLGDAHFVFVG
jgi:acetaldehyde dehydrogenase (acetylating)